MNLVTKTVYYDDLILCHFRNKEFKPLDNTTLNEKFNINKEITTIIDTPILGYYCLGNGNNKVIDSESNFKLYHGNHRVIDGALFNHIPFVLRLKDEDIGVVERRKYRLRKSIFIENEEYIAYYLKVIPNDAVVNQLLKVTTNTDTMSKLEKFNTNDSTILNPTIGLSSLELLTEGNEYIINSDQVTLSLTTEELLEVNRAMEILSIKEEDRVINEIALCSGTDTLDMTDYSNEVAYCQIMFFLDIDYDVQLLLSTEDTFYRQIEIGGMEPLRLK